LGTAVGGGGLPREERRGDGEVKRPGEQVTWGDGVLLL